MGRTLRVAAVPALTVLGLAGAAVPAEAASGSLTVVAIDRSGHSVKTKAYLLNPATWVEPTYTTGTTHRLKSGRWGVMVVIKDGTSQTLGARSVSIGTKHVNLTFDARKGKEVRITPGGSPSLFSADVAVCVDNQGIYAMDYSGAFWTDITSYAIPTTDKHMQVKYYSVWANSPAGPFHSARSGPAYGISTRPVYDYTHASFAKVLVNVTKGKATAKSATFWTEPIGGCSYGTSTWGTFNAPRTITSYVTTGSWRPYITYDNGLTQAKAQRFVAPKTYHVTIKRP